MTTGDVTPKSKNLVKKVLDFGFFLATVSAMPTPAKGTLGKAEFFALMKKQYPPEEGWEMVNSHFLGGKDFMGDAANGYEFVVFLQQVEYA